jgi:hypothetical protein
MDPVKACSICMVVSNTPICLVPNIPSIAAAIGLLIDQYPSQFLPVFAEPYDSFDDLVDQAPNDLYV